MSKHNSQFLLTVPSSMTNKIPAIKSIRILTGLGLKEAKDVTDSPGDHLMTLSGMFIDYTGEHNHIRTELEREFLILRGQGFAVGHAIHNLLQDLRRLGAQALEMGEDDFAGEILQMVVAEKLRRGI